MDLKHLKIYEKFIFENSEELLDLSFREEMRDYHSQQKYLSAYAISGGENIGRVDYSIYKNDLHIEYIEIDPRYRRKRVASKLMDFIKKENPDKKIIPGYTTDSGDKFWKKYSKKESVSTLKSPAEIDVDEDEFQIRTAAWLYFLTYPYYPEGMEAKNWDKDKRMELSFLDAMNHWIDLGLVELKNGIYKVKNRDKAKKILYSVFGQFKNRAEAEKSKQETSLKKYDTKDYVISRIPFEMFDRDEEEEYEVSTKTSNLDYHAYDDIRAWYKKYQRYSQGWWNKLDRYLGAEGELFPRKEEYVLYRGVKVTTEEGFKNSISFVPKKGSFVWDKGKSWTWSPGMAWRFSVGRDNWMSRKELGEKEIGLILKYNFDPEEILMDTNFVKSKISIDFPEEKEVIVKPSKRKVEIFQVIYPKANS